MAESDKLERAAPGNKPVAPASFPLSHAVVYQIYPDIFSAEGTFTAVTARLASLRDLGVNIIYLMPITPTNGPVHGHGFFGPRGSPYAVQYFYMVNPKYGTEGEFRSLLSNAHLLGMKVIVDQVLNHTGWSNGLIASHPEWYARDHGGKILAGAHWSPAPWQDTAQLDYYGEAATGLKSYMISMLMSWVARFPIDGFRFDTASYHMRPVADRPNIPFSFWRSLGAALKSINPELILLGEVLEPALALNPFDIGYGWNLYNSLQSAFSSGRGGADRVRQQYETQQPPAFHKEMMHLNILQDWDKAADHIAFGGFAQSRAAAVINMTLPGVPLIFNGQEAANTNFGAGGTGHNTMMTIDWNGSKAAETRAFFKALLSLRNNNPALQEGALTWVSNDGEDRVLSFLRRDSDTAFLIVVNLSAAPVSGRLSGVPKVPGWTGVSPQGCSDEKKESRGLLLPPHFSLQPHQFCIFEGGGAAHRKQYNPFNLRRLIPMYRQV